MYSNNCYHFFLQFNCRLYWLSEGNRRRPGSDCAGPAVACVVFQVYDLFSTLARGIHGQVRDMDLTFTFGTFHDRRWTLVGSASRPASP